MVLPAVEVATGDYIVIHATASGLGEDEHANADQSNHELALPGVWDFWIQEGTGLSGRNGVLTVHATPGGALLDGVLYSNRTSESDERYRGFGSKATMLRADRLAELGGWQLCRRSDRPGRRDQLSRHHLHALAEPGQLQYRYRQRRRLAHRAHPQSELRCRQQRRGSRLSYG